MLPFGFEVTGIGDGMGAKITPGLQSKPNNISPTLPPPPQHTHKEKQTNRQKEKEKIRYLMKTHLHKKYVVKYSTPKNQGIRKPQTPPPLQKNPSIIPSFAIRTSPGIQGVSSDDLLLSSKLRRHL